ncbi:MAG: diguanylate cyclase [Lachnospiraceae bacterium]|nr:diguanylate cyclase [Lachnospiraceae bacterium]
MLEFLAAHQLNLMLALSGICGTIAIFVIVTHALPYRRKKSLIGLEITAMLLLSFDRLAYIYSGDLTRTGYIMVRLTNFMVFSLTLMISLFVNFYLSDLLLNEGGLEKLPGRMPVINYLCAAGVLLIVISQFTGWYYYFDEFNKYQRGPLFIVCYVFPTVVTLLQLTVILQYRKNLARGIYLSLMLFLIVPLVASIFQIFLYGLSLTNISIVGMGALLYIFALLDINERVEENNKLTIESVRDGQRKMKRLFVTTAKTLVDDFVDAPKEEKGHSVRVAHYARMIAVEAGLDEDKCDRVYCAALLHNTNDESFKNSEEFPYLAAGFNCEDVRYDGGDDPTRLRGDKIPAIVRIIAIADAYDLMTSKQGDTDPLPQAVVREEFVKGQGNRFDPDYTDIMLSLIDKDKKYKMRAEIPFAKKASDELVATYYRSDVTRGFSITTAPVRIKFNCKHNIDPENPYSGPAIILFDSLDGFVHSTKKSIEETRYVEYGEAWFDGNVITTMAKQIKVTPVEMVSIMNLSESEYMIEAVKNSDHIRLRLYDKNGCVEMIAALPATTKTAYVSLTGENCILSDMVTEKDVYDLKGDDIPRLCEEVRYTNRLESDVPNIQIDGMRTSSTEGIKINDGVRIMLHAMSLPIASLVWHCPYIILFYSDDGKIMGPNYKEYALIRFDGEVKTLFSYSENTTAVERTDKFSNWEAFKEENKKGYESTITFQKHKNKVITKTENAGISIVNTTIIKDGPREVYVALTGDECALTDIRIFK